MEPSSAATVQSAAPALRPGHCCVHAQDQAPSLGPEERSSWREARGLPFTLPFEMCSISQGTQSQLGLKIRNRSIVFMQEKGRCLLHAISSSQTEGIWTHKFKAKIHIPIYLNAYFLTNLKHFLVYSDTQHFYLFIYCYAGDKVYWRYYHNFGKYSKTRFVNIMLPFSIGSILKRQKQ